VAITTLSTCIVTPSNMTRFSNLEIDFVADDPVLRFSIAITKTIQDEGFMGLMTYV
jgi:hypothetical protein